MKLRFTYKRGPFTLPVEVEAASVEDGKMRAGMLRSELLSGRTSLAKMVARIDPTFAMGHGWKLDFVEYR